MKEWIKITILLCAIGFFKECHVSAPYTFEYLIGPWRNLTSEDVTEKYYPICTYSNCAQLAIVFLITDALRYKILIIVMCLTGCGYSGMYCFTRDRISLAILMVVYGTYCATENAYFTYIYAKVSKDVYLQVTSYTRAAILAGKSFSFVAAQIIVWLKLLDYHQLNYLTFSGLVIAAGFSFFLPRVEKSIYFHREESRDNATGKIETQSRREALRNAMKLLRKHTLDFIRNIYVLQWSLYWFTSTCGYLLVMYYAQPLWTTVAQKKQTLLNGLVEAAATLFGFLTTVAAGFIHINWKEYGFATATFCTMVSFGLIYLAAVTKYVIVCYVCYVSYGGIYFFMITIASSEIAEFIDEDSYGLVFGFNTLVATTLQTIATIGFVSDVGFGLTPRKQYIFFAYFHLGLFFLLLIITIRIIIVKRYGYGSMINLPK